MNIYNDVLEDLIAKSYVIMTFLDFSTAFDTVDHKILIKRIVLSSGIAVCWFKSYLSNRS